MNDQMNQPICGYQNGYLLLQIFLILLIIMAIFLALKFQ